MTKKKERKQDLDQETKKENKILNDQEKKERKQYLDQEKKKENKISTKSKSKF